MAAFASLPESLLHRAFLGAGPSSWFPLLCADQEVSQLAAAFLEALPELDAKAHPGLSLQQLADACPSLSLLRLNCLPVSDRDLCILCLGLSRLRSLQLRECSAITDVGLSAVFSSCTELRCLDISWNEHVTDAPFPHMPLKLEKLYAVGCKKLTEAAVSHLGARCSELQVLHVARSLDRIGATPSELAVSVRKLKALREVSLLDFAFDEDLISALASLPLLRSVEIWSFDVGAVTETGIVRLAEGLGDSLFKLSLDTLCLRGSRALEALAESCPALAELMLDGSGPGQEDCCQLGCLEARALPGALVKLRLPSCGLQGTFDCSELQCLRLLNLFDNEGLTGLKGASQPLRALNIGATSCTQMEGFSFEHLELLDVSDLGWDDAEMERLLLCCHSLKWAVLGGNCLSSSLLTKFVSQAWSLTHLSVSSCGDLVELAQSLVKAPPSASCAPSMELMELSEQAVPAIAEWLRPDSSGSGTWLRRPGRRAVQAWILENTDCSSPFGRPDNAADSWLPAEPEPPLFCGNIS